MLTLGVNKGLPFGSASLQIATAVICSRIMTPIKSLESPEGPAFDTVFVFTC